MVSLGTLGTINRWWQQAPGRSTWAWRAGLPPEKCRASQRPAQGTQHGDDQRKGSRLPLQTTLLGLTPVFDVCFWSLFSWLLVKGHIMYHQREEWDFSFGSDHSGKANKSEIPVRQPCTSPLLKPKTQAKVSGAPSFGKGLHCLLQAFSLGAIQEPSTGSPNSPHALKEEAKETDSTQLSGKKVAESYQNLCWDECSHLKKLTVQML